MKTTVRLLCLFSMFPKSPPNQKQCLSQPPRTRNLNSRSLVNGFG